MPTLAATLACARSQLGYQEPGWGDRPGTQITKYGVWYASWARQPAYKDTYWCAMFQSWVLSVAGWSVEAAGRFGNCNPWIAWLKRKKMWHSEPRAGALVFFDWDRDGRAEHIGMVESVRPDGRIVTLEGNASQSGRRDGVFRMVRSRSNILGYGWLPYDAPPAAPKIGLVSPPSKTRVVKRNAVSAKMPGPVAVPKGLGHAPWTVDARAKRWDECPSMPVGFGGPGDKAEAIWATYWYALMARWSPKYFAQLVNNPAGKREVSRREIGPVTVQIAEKMLRSVQKTNTFRGVIPPVAWSLYQP